MNISWKDAGEIWAGLVGFAVVAAVLWWIVTCAPVLILVGVCMVFGAIIGDASR